MPSHASNKNGVQKPAVLLTGATGFLGRRLAAALIANGYRTRALVRRQSDPAHLAHLGADIHFGDIGDIESVASAMRGTDIVVHAAADTRASDGGPASITIRGTENILQAAKALGIEQLVYISTCNVYGISECRTGSVVDETGPLERHPEMRGPYTLAKFKAEQAVLEEMKDGRIAITCLRPGTIWGPEGEIFTPMMGFRAGLGWFCMLGSGRFVLPLVYLDNLVSAIVTTLQNKDAYNRVYNVVDPEPITKRQYANQVLKRIYPGAHVFYLPYPVVYSMVRLQEFVFGILRREPVLTRYRLISSQRCIIYDSKRLQEELNWRPPVGIQDAIAQIVGHFAEKQAVQLKS